VDRKFTCIGESGCRMIVASRPGAADDKDDIGFGFDERSSDRHFIALDRDAFSNDTAIALDRDADHQPVAVLPRASFGRLSDQYPHTRVADDRNPGQPGDSEQPDMTHLKPRPGGHQRRSNRRNSALLFDIITRGNRFDDLNAGLVVGLG
jgi:hypothetical protein